MPNIKLAGFKRTIRKINAMAPAMEKLTEEEMRAKTEELKNRAAGGESLDKLLPESFALVREAAKRVLGYGHYDVQLLGGVALHKGYLAEMRTGEGKTLVSTAPAFLNALAGNGVHVVTVNDYLASRDSEWVGRIHRLLGLSVGCVVSGMSIDERKKAYACDITYVTNNELGFDYLRDNMATSKDTMVLRGLSYCIIDETDSVLVDEARTPLIISGPGNEVTKLYRLCDILARQMVRGEETEKFSRALAWAGEEIEESGDFIVDEDSQTAILTSEGVKKTEEFFGIENLADEENTDIRHHVILAIRAHYLMERDVDYIVKGREVLIVDEFTGRVMEGRRYSDGLHQAIEAKEHVEVQSESLTMATVTFQNFFNKYDKKSGMSGTAYTQRKEFRETYGMDVLRIPTNRPVLREDRPDFVFKTKEEKYHAVIREVEEAHGKQQPVLVGTTSIETSELLSEMLKERGIPHQVLNAKFDKEEADIVEKAGEAGAVTIATNMAGRGTDIKLSEKAKEAGGLKVIGTERHESRRIDDQLRGRSGRQGDPGDSRFFLSLEDDLLKYNGNENLAETLKDVKTEEGQPIRHRKMGQFVSRAQEKVELNNYGTRENLLAYDMVDDTQRETVYQKRLELICSADVHSEVLGIIRAAAERGADRQLMSAAKADGKPRSIKERRRFMRDMSNRAEQAYEEMVKAVGNPARFMQVERSICLRILDAGWVRHLADMEKLREVIRYQSIGMRDPAVEYRVEAARMFEEMMTSVEDETADALMGLGGSHKKPEEASVLEKGPAEVASPIEEPKAAEPDRAPESQEISEAREATVDPETIKILQEPEAMEPGKEQRDGEKPKSTERRQAEPDAAHIHQFILGGPDGKPLEWPGGRQPKTLDLNAGSGEKQAKNRKRGRKKHG